MSDEKLNNSGNIAQFCNFSSSVNLVFWPHVAKLKLEVVKLDSQRPVPITGSYSCPKKPTKDVTKFIPPLVLLNEQSLLTSDSEATGSSNTINFTNFKLPGLLRIFDKIEEVTKGRKEISTELTNKLLEDMSSDLVLRQPGLFGQFFMSCFLNIKKYIHTYHFCFPVLLPSGQHTLLPPKEADTTEAYTCSLTDIFSDSELDNLKESFITFLKETIDNNDSDSFGGFFLCKLDKEDDKSSFKCGLLSEWDNFFDSSSDKETENVFIGFTDPSPQKDLIGWPLRNFFYYASRFKKLSTVKMIRLNCQPNQIDLNLSYFTKVSLGDCPADVTPKVAGWERGTEGRAIKARTIDVSQMLNPEEQAASAVQLNLKLMKWRAEPAVDLDIISQSKCLLLGAGTLGAYVSRSLLGWGVNCITFVDNGKVSFSNPVRQPLYEYTDCLEGGKAKAQAAAECLRRIHPKIVSDYRDLTIPMPGHSLSEVEVERTSQAIEELEKLIKEHDIIFLLTDSRESRWLPTLFASLHNRLVINAALGFDSFVVMRHGIRKSESDSEPLSDPNLGCYFCQDVIAPTDSISDRTLDEQCTVTRPGIAGMASAFAVELMVSTLQHPQKGLANPPGNASKRKDGNDTSILPTFPPNRLAEVIPHQIRGFLGTFSSINVEVQAYPQCIACSNKVLDAYREEGFEFLKKVFNDPQHLSNVTGINSLLENIDDIDLSGSGSESDDFDLVSDFEPKEKSTKDQSNDDTKAKQDDSKCEDDMDQVESSQPQPNDDTEAKPDASSKCENVIDQARNFQPRAASVDKSTQTENVEVKREESRSVPSEIIPQSDDLAINQDSSPDDKNPKTNLDDPGFQVEMTELVPPKNQSELAPGESHGTAAPTANQASETEVKGDLLVDGDSKGIEEPGSLNTGTVPQSNDSEIEQKGSDGVAAEAVAQPSDTETKQVTLEVQDLDSTPSETIAQPDDTVTKQGTKEAKIADSVPLETVAQTEDTVDKQVTLKTEEAECTPSEAVVQSSEPKVNQVTSSAGQKSDSVPLETVTQSKDTEANQDNSLKVHNSTNEIVAESLGLPPETDLPSNDPEPKQEIVEEDKKATEDAEEMGQKETADTKDSQSNSLEIKPDDLKPESHDKTHLDKDTDSAVPVDTVDDAPVNLTADASKAQTNSPTADTATDHTDEPAIPLTAPSTVADEDTTSAENSEPHVPSSEKIGTSNWNLEEIPYQSKVVESDDDEF